MAALVTVKVAGALMVQAFFEDPILNSPYEAPGRHHALDEKSGQPLNLPPIQGRRRSALISPVPAAKRKGRKALQEDLFAAEDEEQQNLTLTIINEIRAQVTAWRALKNPADWGVTPVTQRLLTYWRDHNFETVRPFFCQVEAVETAIWLTEVAPKQRQHAKFWEYIRSVNADANPALIRIALKLATGAGKTTVMAMLMAWQTLNAVRAGDAGRFSRAFLIVAPGITIRDRLQVLLPSHPDNYYAHRELVPADMLLDMAKAKIVLTNYHAFKPKETMDLSKVGRAFLQGRDEAIRTIETDGAMLKRVCGELLAFKNVVVINDEAHHCYRERAGNAEAPVAAEDKEEAKRNKEAARLWISGLEALKRKVGARTVYDLSATPFFLRGSGYREGTLFPWTVSDFSLMDAIECGIVKLPRIPVADSSLTADAPIYRELWEHIGKRMPKKGAGKSGDLDPLSASFPAELQTALYALYSHYEKTYEAWERAGIEAPPVFIVVCNNTATSKLVYEWIAGFEREEDGETRFKHAGHLALFRNYDEHGNRLTRFNTVLVDSEALESGEALDSSYILARNPQDGSAVLIENQLEASDHMHLGQIMTYLTGLDAKTMIWVAPSFREEHLSALRWLNEHTVDPFAFFAVRVRVVQIADSPLAPLFEVLERPNGWDRQLQEVARESRELSEIGVFRRAFWTHLLERHPGSVAFGPARADSSRWRPVAGQPLVVVEFLAQQTVGVFVRGPRGSSREAAEALLRPLGSTLTERLGVPFGNDPAGLLVKSLRIDSRAQEKWDEMSDWLEEQAATYVIVLAATLAENSA
jgi:hypothetical protein